MKTVAFSPQFIGGCKRWHSRELQRLICKHGFRVLGAYNQTHTLWLTLPPRLRKRKRIRKNRCKTEKQQSDIRSQCHASVFQCIMRTCHTRLCGGANARGSSQTPDLLEGLRSLLKSQARATRMQHNLPFAISQEFSHASTAETIL